MASGRIIAVVLFHVFFTGTRCANLNLASHLRSSLGGAKRSGWQEALNPDVEPPQMLIFSSPMERKVSYTAIENFKSKNGGKILPILDAGLMGPYGITWDAKRSVLYICDADARKILRVKLKGWKCTQYDPQKFQVDCNGMMYQLRVDGNIYAVVENVIAQWVAVDADGNLFFTNQATNSVNKLPVHTINNIVKGKIQATNLLVTSEAEAASEEAAEESVYHEELAEASGVETTTLSTTPEPPTIYALYDKESCPNVGTPAGVTAEGSRLYWTNQVGGFGAGAVVEGQTTPVAKEMDSGAKGGGEEEPTFPSFKLANNSGSTYGVALTSSKIVYTQTAHEVYAMSRGTQEVVALTNTLLKPRGVVWDGDNTVYVADQEANYIVSIPVGLLKPNAPVSQVVDFHAPFGIALAKPDDPVWDPLKPWYEKEEEEKPVKFTWYDPFSWR